MRRIGNGQTLLDQKANDFIHPNPLLEYLPIAAYGVRAPDGVVVWFNRRAAELWGRVPKLGDTDERFCGSYKLFYPDGSSMAHADTPVAFALHTGNSVHQAEVVIERPDSTRVTVCVHIDAIRDENKNIIGVVNFFDDITDRKKKEGELRELSEKLRTLNTQLEQENSDRKLAQESLEQSEERFRRLAESLEHQIKKRTRQLEDQSKQVRELSRTLLRTQDEERRHLARELHDSAGQTLAAIGIHLEQAVQEADLVAPRVTKRLEEVQSMVQQLNRDIRTTSYLLHPPLLDETGLSSALNWFVQGFGERSGITITLDVADDLGRLPGDMELAIFRVAQECLTNIHRHSGADGASIRLQREDGSVQVEVSDNGKGIPQERLTEIQSGGSGVGIRGMQERLHHFGAEMKIETAASGTRVVARFPLPKQTSPVTQVDPFQTTV